MTRVIFALTLLVLLASTVHAQHLRIFACAIANDSTGAFLGGSSNGSGLYQSDDTGKTWKHLGWDNIKCYSMDEVNSSKGRILYEATGLGILRSTDYGAHWKQLTDWRISEAMDVAVNQKNPNEIYVATAHGPWRTEDGGKTWNYLAGVDPPYCSRVIYAPDSSGFAGFVLGAESGLYWRSETDTGWQSSVGGPVDVRDIKVRIGKLRTDERTHKNYRIVWWFAASAEDGIYISRDGLNGFSGRRHKYREPRGSNPIWCVCQDEDGDITGGPNEVAYTQYGSDYANSTIDRQDTDVACCLMIGNTNILGRLGEGVEIAHHFYLPDRQIWTLKSFLITP